MWRLRGFLRGLGKLLLLCVALLALFLGWRAFLRWGPSLVNRGSTAPPAMFAFQAKVLLKPLESIAPPEVLLPVPQHLSSPDMQLKLMKLRDDKNWLPAALALGELRKQGILLYSGSFVPEEILSVGPAQTQGSTTRCQVKIRARWVFPEILQELYRVRDLVGLKLPKTWLPGQSVVVTCTFMQRGWDWDLVAVDPELIGRIERPMHPEGLAGWFF
jgi:hypothetical protein